ncbi:MAG: aminotransferase class I/II-fold pyridoxal phosphate-dependent enzyme [Clostridiaceae bacterium]|jgi:aromatic-amino-acid transaminase|nr:aminotransferase class I/II-fold pyridoxal phosphate-dependent enzyme [Clostridiaceae bacterium]
MNSVVSMVAKHVNTIRSEDKIFAVNREAVNAALQFGKENVVNATVGSILDEDEKLAVLPSVLKTLRNLPDSEFAAYAPIIGTPDYLEAAIQATFKEYRPEGYIKASATPGGTGALRQTIWNYSEVGDTILTSDWFWGPYRTLAEENLRKLSVFSLFDNENRFNLNSLEMKVKELLERQDSLVILLNSPAQNPTGYALSDEEWEQVIMIIKRAASGQSKRITLLCDIAYIDYAGKASDTRKFMRLFSGLPSNVLAVVSFSISKSLAMYGLRTGAAICVSSSKDVTEEFSGVLEASSRGTWSNGTRCGMKLLSEIMNNKELLHKVDEEREELRQLLDKRAEVFINEAKSVKLGTCPYKSGFFVTIPAAQPEESCKLMKKDNIFAVPLSRGIRFAICSVPLYKMKGIAGKIKKAVE